MGVTAEGGGLIYLSLSPVVGVVGNRPRKRIRAMFFFVCSAAASTKFVTRNVGSCNVQQIATDVMCGQCKQSGWCANSMTISPMANQDRGCSGRSLCVVVASWPRGGTSEQHEAFEFLMTCWWPADESKFDLMTSATK